MPKLRRFVEESRFEGVSLPEEQIKQALRSLGFGATLTKTSGRVKNAGEEPTDWLSVDVKISVPDGVSEGVPKFRDVTVTRFNAGAKRGEQPKLVYWEAQVEDWSNLVIYSSRLNNFAPSKERILHMFDKRLLHALGIPLKKVVVTEEPIVEFLVPAALTSPGIELPKVYGFLSEVREMTSLY